MVRESQSRMDARGRAMLDEAEYVSRWNCCCPAHSRGFLQSSRAHTPLHLLCRIMPPRFEHPSRSECDTWYVIGEILIAADQFAGVASSLLRPRTTASRTLNRRGFQTALSRDNLWVTKAEHKRLCDGEFPVSLQRRIARFHLVDNTRGEPPMWRESEIRELDIQLGESGQLTGSVLLENRSQDRGYEAALRGEIETSDGRVTKLQIVCLGQFWGEGTFTRGAPQGRFPLAISLTLADGSDTADSIPPQGSRGWIDGYLK